MVTQIHFIPVGFDFERLIYPISKGDMTADQVVLIDLEDDSEDDEYSPDAELAANMRRRLSESFEMIGIDVEQREIPDLYDYENLYSYAHRQVWSELQEEKEVFVNISSMPRPISFAYATAVDSIVAEHQEFRDSLHTYYVAPESYLAIEMLEMLKKQAEFLMEIQGDQLDFSTYEHINEINSLVDKVQRKGITEGVTEIGDNLYVEFPSSPGSELQEFEKLVLRFLNSEGLQESTSSLAEKLAEQLGEEYGDSFRSRVQYNVSLLDEKGYVHREKKGNRYETTPSTMGRMWVETHEHEVEDGEK